MTQIAAARWDNRDGPRRCVNTAEGLTHSSGTSREGLAMKATRTCSVADCDSPHTARGMCDKHYRNLRRHGTPTAPARPRRGVCSVDDCAEPHEASGYCHAHYMQLRRKGDPLARSPRVADNSPTWTGDAVGYSGAHRRLRKHLGSASAHPCADCGGTAEHWAYDHADPTARPSPVGDFSTNPAHYMPLCAPCHKAFDTRHRHHIAYLER